MLESQLRMEEEVGRFFESLQKKNIDFYFSFSRFYYAVNMFKICFTSNKKADKIQWNFYSLIGDKSLNFHSSKVKIMILLTIQ